MTELKTLKDLVEPFRENDKKAEMFEAIVKQEAIKWIKVIHEDEEMIEKFDYGTSLDYWIREFFNITEEDLK